MFDVYPYQNLPVQFPEVGPLVVYGRNVQGTLARPSPVKWAKVKVITFHQDGPLVGGTAWLQVRVSFSEYSDIPPIGVVERRLVQAWTRQPPRS